MGDNEKILQEIMRMREDIATVKAVLEGSKENFEIQFDSIDKKVNKIEDNMKWLWRTIGGTLIAGVVNFIVNGGLTIF